MKQRCLNPKKREFPHYGGRGIAVYPEWVHSFIAFYAYVGQKPSPAHSLDRIDVNKGYEPGNVRWATQQQQAENTRVTRLVTLQGRIQTIAAWSRENGLSIGQVHGRLKSGWSLQEAIQTPSVPGQKRHKYVPQGYSKLRNGWFRVMLDGKYIKTVRTEDQAIELVAIARAAALAPTP